MEPHESEIEAFSVDTTIKITPQLQGWYLINNQRVYLHLGDTLVLSPKVTTPQSEENDEL